jgi:hypothetical protein
MVSTKNKKTNAESVIEKALMGATKSIDVLVVAFAIESNDGKTIMEIGEKIKDLLNAYRYETTGKAKTDLSINAVTVGRFMYDMVGIRPLSARILIDAPEVGTGSED